VSAEVAGAFLNLEPLVGAMLGIVAFGDPAGTRQFAGGLAIVVGITLGGLPLLARRPVPGRRSRPPGWREGVDSPVRGGGSVLLMTTASQNVASLSPPVLSEG
jgi:hypothetical protein